MKVDLSSAAALRDERERGRVECSLAYEEALDSASDDWQGAKEDRQGSNKGSESATPRRHIGPRSNSVLRLGSNNVWRMAAQL